ncbi:MULTISPECIES: filamentous hemagglutinin N-terminal domain-containing protein [unclassified Pseudomonas]|uniref:two-partner secretion domain-containing protein n=1 Tax=unclassified Pseudomonas TaxID=196821 RepID=UPI00244B38C3|nr:MULTISPECIES: filamentous hemagglutinin N-terminal domain-containing protein [unclassified Pseudomonas]MDG9924301.1 filamentous hemagglutinin N-terminal domain-containing protein [Pseudomonas sp. GD04045]MDH0033342.1 filamentous hemagglutinin N-terminal domain-containing protein [Pseudomonas sp. GD04019]
MNHAYRLIWNAAHGAYVPAPENARGRGKQASGRILLAALLVGASGQALALPTDGQVSLGQGSIASSGGNMTVTQSSQNLAINWNSFNIAQGEKVSFAQPNSSAIAVNRVVGSDPSSIYGTLQANGQVFLINPNGILFGKGSQVNVGGLVASTLDLSDQDLAAGNYTFAGEGGSVTNQGNITAKDGGSVALLGARVSNEGTIQARLGSVALAAGEQVSLDFAGDQLLSVQVDKGALQALAQNKQLIQADGGQVILTAKAADSLLNSVVNNEGVVEAGSLSTRNGVIRLEGDRLVNTGTLDASGETGGRISLAGQGIIQAGAIHADGDGGAVSLDASHGALQTTQGQITANGSAAGGSIRFNGGDSSFVSGSLSATGQRGGEITVSGQTVNLAAATVKVDGTKKGGSIRIGGDAHGANPEVSNARTTGVNAHSNLSAKGADGDIVVWSDERTDFRGQATTGERGFIEVSSKGTLNYGGQVNAGQGGEVLFDPTNLVITDTVSDQFYIDLADPNPQPGALHGDGNIVQLDNGNIAVSAPGAHFGNIRTGAAFLYNGTTGGLISALYGNTAGDSIGSGGVAALAGSNVAVASPYWDNGALTDVGAVTWFNGTTGLSGFVTSANSLTGSTASDRVGLKISTLANGNYLIGSAYWNNGGAVGAGAVTFGYANQSTSGVVSASNSLVGSTAGDHVGTNILALDQGNAITWSSLWDNGVAVDAGAVTWMSQDGPTVGVIGATNSMVGSQTNDFVGTDSNFNSGIVSLSNGNVLVFSKHWHLTPTLDTGAVTWMSGSGPTTGVVDASNSVIGSSAADRVGYVSNHPYDDKPSYVELTNGNVVVTSGYWNSSAGAATWMSGTGPTAGVIGSGNSVVGSTANDRVGSFGVTVLSNGNYVVNSPYWSDGLNPEVGAATWGNGNGGTAGVISAANSLVGSTAYDRVGLTSTALSNGHYVVSSPYWSDGINAEVGASTWGNGNGGTVGLINAGNSLVGSSAYDHVGFSATALTNGHYVVTSQHWNDVVNGLVKVGAVTWGNGNGSTVGAVSASNSMVGDLDDDEVGNGGIVALAGGNYLIRSFQWHDFSGNVAWRDGSAASTGIFDSSNAMTGTWSPSITVLSNGKFVLNNALWGDRQGYVAVGSNDGSFVGSIDSTNALVGGYRRASLGSEGGVLDLGNGHFVVYGFTARNPDAGVSAGSITFIDSDAPLVGLTSASNTFYGAAGDRLTRAGLYVLPNHDYLVPYVNWSANGSTPNAGAVAIGSGSTGLAGYASASNSLVGLQAGDELGSGGIQLLTGNNFLVRSPNATVDGHGSAGSLWLVQRGADFASTVNNSAGNQAVSPGAIASAAVAGSTLTLQASNDITVNSAISVDGALKLEAGNNLTLNASITSQATGTAIELAGQTFINNVGSNALSTPNGRWLVWSANPAGDTRGGLDYDFKQYNASYGTTTVAGSGNGFLYSLAPTLSAQLVGTVAKTYDGTTSAALSAANYALSGSIDGDAVLLNTPTTGRYDNASVGTGKTVTSSGLSIISVDSAGKPVYGYQIAEASGNVGTILPQEPVTPPVTPPISNNQDPRIDLAWSLILPADKSAVSDELQVSEVVQVDAGGMRLPHGLDAPTGIRSFH